MYITLEEDRLQGIVESLTTALNHANTLLTSIEVRKNAPFSKMSKEEQIRHVISGMSDYYHIPEDRLFSTSRTAAYTKRKKFASKILGDYSSANQDEIAELLHYSERSSVSNAIAKLDEWLCPKPFGDEEIRREWDGLMLHLKISQ